MSDNSREPEIIIEEKTADEELLSKFETPAKAKKTKKKNGNIQILIVCLVGAVILGVIIALLIFLPKDTEESGESSGIAAVEASVGEDKVWQANVEKDGSGKVKDNGSGTLIEQTPASISEINIENEDGTLKIKSYTPVKKTKETDPDTGEQASESQETVYTIVGYEDFEIQSGAPDEIANACANLTFLSVSSADASSDLSEFGFDKPRSITKVSYTDGTKAVIKVGADAPQNLGTYVMFGDGNEVYLCETSLVEPLLHGVNKLISLNVSDPVSDTENADPKSVILGGTARKTPVTLKQNTDTEHISNNYIVTSPVTAYADNDSASSVTGAIRGLYAEAVKFVNPSASQLSEVGLSSPYAAISAVYGDKTFKYIASKPDGEGKVYLMEKGGKIVYEMKSASLGWVTVSLDDLISDYVLNVNLSSLSGMTVKSGSGAYDFRIKTTVTKTTDEDGEESESSNTVTTYNGDELDEGNFETFFRNLSLLTKAENKSSKPSGSPALTVVYDYEKGRSSDTLAFYKSGANTYALTINGDAAGKVYSTYVEKLIKQAPEVAKGKEVKSFW